MLAQQSWRLPSLHRDIQATFSISSQNLQKSSRNAAAPVRPRFAARLHDSTTGGSKLIKLGVTKGGQILNRHIIWFPNILPYKSQRPKIAETP